MKSVNILYFVADKMSAQIAEKKNEQQIPTDSRTQSAWKTNQ